MGLTLRQQLEISKKYGISKYDHKALERKYKEIQDEKKAKRQAEKQARIVKKTQHTDPEWVKENLADPSTGKVYLYSKSEGEYDLRSVSPETYAKKYEAYEKQELKTTTKAKYEEYIQKDIANARKKAEERQQQREVTKLLEKSGIEATPERIQNTVVLSPEEYQKFKAKTEIARNTPDLQPVIMQGQVYYKKSEAVKEAVQKSFGERLQEAQIKEQTKEYQEQVWENKKQLAEFNEQVRQMHSELWAEKRAGVKEEQGIQEPVTVPIERKASIQESQVPEGVMSTQESIDLMNRQAVQKQFGGSQIINLNPQAGSDLQEKVEVERAMAGWDWRHPIKSLRKESEKWSQDIEAKSKASGAVFDIYQKAKEETIGEQRQIFFGQQESISPQEFKTVQEKEIKGPSAIATVSKVTGTAFAGVAGGAKEVLIDIPLHPIKSAKEIVSTVVHPIETTKEMGSMIIKEPIKSVTQLGTSLYLFGKVSKGVHRVLKPYDIEIPIKAKGLKTLKTAREGIEGEISTKGEIHVETVEGKPQKKLFFQESKIEPRKQVSVKLDTTRRSSFEGPGHLEQKATVNGVLHIDQGKVKLKIKDYTETQAPVPKSHPAQHITKKTPSGVPLEGETPKLKRQQPRIQVSKKTRAGYEYSKVIDKDVMFFDEKLGKFVEYPHVEEIQVQVPEKTKLKHEIVKTKIYATEKPLTGKLLFEEHGVGKIVKRKYTRGATKQPPQKPGGPPSPPPGVEIEILKSGEVKAFSMTESGGKVPYVGPKPKAPSPRLKIVTEQIPMETESMADLPVVDVKTINAKVSGANMPVLAPQSQSPETKEPTLYAQEGVPISSKQMETPIMEAPLYGMTATEPIIGTESMRSQSEPVITTYKPEFEGISIEPPIIATETIEVQKEEYEPIIDVGSITEENQEEAIEPIIDVAQFQEDLQEQRYIPRLDLKQQYKPIEEIDLEDFGYEQPKEKPFKKFKHDEEFFEDLWKGFDVYVKSKGKFIKLNKQGSFEKEEALFRGAEFVEQTPSATFKIVPSKEPVQKASGMRKISILDQFYQKEEGLYIEKSKYRINQPGEVAGISRLGQMARKGNQFVKEARRVLPKVMREFEVPSIAGESNKKRKGGNLFGRVLK